MGSVSSKKLDETEDVDKGVYRVKAKDISAMKNVWKIVENDLPYYGSVFSTILFQNHPQYVKYFQEDNIPEYVQDARIKKKFSAVCSIVSALFIDYSKKRNQRDHLLSYIAMIHKDMNLSSEDLENFMTDLLEMLIQERPKEMTAECTVVHMRYFSGLLPRIAYFMKVQREKDFYLLKTSDKPPKTWCSWLSQWNSPTIYGRPLEYWIGRKHYWELKVAVWHSIDMELSEISSFLITKTDYKKLHYSETDKRSFRGRQSMFACKNKVHPWLTPTRHYHSLTISSGSTNNNDQNINERPNWLKLMENNHSPTVAWYERYKRSERRQRRHSLPLTTSKRMESIPEVHSQLLIDSAICTPVKTSRKNTQAFLDAVKVLKTKNIHAESLLSSTALEHKIIIDTGGPRKRRRDKKKDLYPQITN